MSTQAELAAELRSVKDRLVKIGAETTNTLEKVTALEAVIAAGGATTPEVDQALQEVKDAAQAADDLVPDPVP